MSIKTPTKDKPKQPLCPFPRGKVKIKRILHRDHPSEEVDTIPPLLDDDGDDDDDAGDDDEDDENTPILPHPIWGHLCLLSNVAIKLDQEEKRAAKLAALPPFVNPEKVPSIKPPNKVSTKQKKRPKTRRNNNTDKKYKTSNNSKRICFHCSTKDTKQWRTGTIDDVDLCNACGLFFQRLRRVSTVEAADKYMSVLRINHDWNRKVPDRGDLTSFSRRMGLHPF